VEGRGAEADGEELVGGRDRGGVLARSRSAWNQADRPSVPSTSSSISLVPDQAHSGPMIGNCAEKPGVLAVERTHGHAREGISGEANPLGRWHVLSDPGGQVTSHAPVVV
jgi:hypothetical protein